MWENVSDYNREETDDLVGARSLEPAQARRAQVVNLITLGAIAVGAFTSLWLFVMWISQPESVKLSTATVGGGILFLGLACYALSRSGWVTMAAWVAVLAAVAIAAYSVIVRGVTSVNVIIFAPTVALAGMLIGSRAAVAVVGIEAFIAVALGLAQNAGWQPPMAQPPVWQGIMVAIGALAFLLLLNGLSWRLMEQSLVLAEAQTERLRAAQEQQQRLVVDLAAQGERQAQLLITLRELSTPVIPVSKGIVVLPLVGHMDAERLTFVRSALLDGIAQHRAKVVLLEMTGLEKADAEIARGLLSLTDAARLLGAELVMVGVQPDVARVVVELDVDTSNLTAQPDLESALDYALARRAASWARAHSIAAGVAGGNGSRS
jgi:anti-anti-sigma regulatory factor